MSGPRPPYGLVAAMDLGRVLGLKNDLPWRLPGELKRFKARTLGATIIMGRRTGDSMPRALPKRINVLLTRREGYAREGFVVVPTLDAALEVAGARGEPALVLGGGEIYKEALAGASFAWLTVIEGRFDGDTWFPALDASQWRCVRRERAARAEGDSHDYEFLDFERRAVGEPGALDWSDRYPVLCV